MSATRGGLRHALGILVLSMSALLGACGPDMAGTPAPSPATGLARYVEPRLGFSFAYPAGWTLVETGAPEGTIVSLTSPDRAVSVLVLYAFPPPTIDLASYGQALVDVLLLQEKGLTLEEETTTVLADGTPARRSRLSQAGEDPRSHELQVAVRAGEEFDEAFLVQAAGPQTTYSIWIQGVRGVMDSLRLDVGR